MNAVLLPLKFMFFVGDIGKHSKNPCKLDLLKIM